MFLHLDCDRASQTDITSPAGTLLVFKKMFFYARETLCALTVNYENVWQRQCVPTSATVLSPDLIPDGKTH